ncbi:MAG: sulfotransferase family 2 domain-containing protein [Planctomycetota bacterium]
MKIVRRVIRKAARHRAKRRGIHPPILNEAVNFEKRCIFIAVPKTGTTSVRLQIRPQGPPLINNPHLDIVQVRDLLYVHLLRNALGKNRAFPSESTPSNAEIRDQAAATFTDLFKFSAVRNPWARAASIYSRREGVETREELSFADFCAKHYYASDTCIHPTRHRNQLDWLCDEHSRCVMDYVYKLEEFDKAIGEIANRTDGRIILQNQVANKNPESASRSYRDLYNQETKSIIAKRFEKDIDHFKYAF